MYRTQGHSTESITLCLSTLSSAGCGVFKLARVLLQPLNPLVYLQASLVPTAAACPDELLSPQRWSGAALCLPLSLLMAGAVAAWAWQGARLKGSQALGVCWATGACHEHQPFHSLSEMEQDTRSRRDMCSRGGSGKETHKYSMKEAGKHVLITALALMYANVTVSTPTKESCITYITWCSTV